ncbi:MAG: hypothetical protein KDE31_33530, partial [Caldilineaceae bacterium]|nr:hypothetical protein [Caldilineaceae bacterium]
ELGAVQQLLEDSLAQLFMPFDHLARTHIQKAVPFRCATTVLATCVEADETVQGARQARLQQQRLYLGAALEMLRIALTIHQLLLQRTNHHASSDDTVPSIENDENERSIAGSIILTGDFCFTQSAILAANTDNIEVVAIFSQTLKQLSEGILSNLFQAREGQAIEERAHTMHGAGFTENRQQAHKPTAEFSDYDIELALCQAGVEGSAALNGLTAEQVDATKAVVALWLDAPAKPLQNMLPSLLGRFPSAQRQRWRAVLSFS